MKNISVGAKHKFLMTVAWWSAVAIINPIGNYPLNDDWAYADVVFHLVAGEGWVFNDWQAMTLVGHVLWGALFCKLFGASYTVLRLSTLVMGFLGVWGVYELVRMSGKASAKVALGIALLIAFNPWYLALSFTFMTDVPFLTLFIWSVYFFLRALKKGGEVGSRRQFILILIGAVLSIWAVAIRQFALLAPFGFGCAYFLAKRNRGALLIAFVPLVVSYLALSCLTLWLASMKGGLTPGFGTLNVLLSRLGGWEWLAGIPERLGQIVFYLALFLLPLTLQNLQVILRNGRFVLLYRSMGLLLVLLLGWSAWEAIPTGNVLYNLGLGPKLLKASYYGEYVSPRLGTTSMALIKLIGFGGAFFLLGSLIRQLISGRSFGELPVVSWVVIGLFGGFLMVDYYFWDRYLLLLFPFTAFLCLPVVTGSSIHALKVTGILLGITLAFFSMSATHDYLAWNRARWQVLDYLTNERGIPPGEIDGGFEFNGRYKTNDLRRNPLSNNGKSWWFVEDDRYVVAFGALTCYEVIDSLAFRQLLPPGKSYIYLLKDTLAERPDTLFTGAERRTPDTLNFLGPKTGHIFGNGDAQHHAYVRTGEYAIKLDGIRSFGFTTQLKNVRPCQRIAVSVWRFGNASAGIVLSSPTPDRFYEFQNEVIRRDTSDWELLSYELTVPRSYRDSTLSIYLWNTNGQEVWFDDFRIVRR